MIKTTSDLLAAFISEEQRLAEAVPMPHMPTLGSAYEAIARDGIERYVLPEDLDLRVVSGFIEGCPRQIDCMLVQGEGKRYLRTDSHFYPARQVLCVLEVKKTLASTSLAEGVMHLAEIQRHCIDDVKARCLSETFDLRFAQRAYEQLSGQIAPTNLHAAHNLVSASANVISSASRTLTRG